MYLSRRSNVKLCQPFDKAAALHYTLSPARGHIRPRVFCLPADLGFHAERRSCRPGNRQRRARSITRRLLWPPPHYFETLELHMTKRVQAKHKIDRRMGQNIWGRPKSPINKREYGPGQHGQRRKGKLSDFGMQLRAKQKL